jgi:hypothetical protein
MHTRKLLASTIGSLLRASWRWQRMRIKVESECCEKGQTSVPPKEDHRWFFLSSCFCGYRFRTCYSIQAKPSQGRPSTLHAQKTSVHLSLNQQNAISFAPLFVVANSTIAHTKMTISILYINSLRVRPWWSSGFTPIGPGPSCSQSFLSKDMWFSGRNFLFPEFSFKRSMVFRSEFFVPRVFFQKICGFQVGIFCSQSFFSKDLWFPGRNFLFPKFSFKRSVVSRSEFLVPRVFFQKIRGFQVEIFCSQSFLSKDLWFLGRNFLFPEFSFKRSVVSRSEFLVPRVFFQKICGFQIEISCSQNFLSKDLWFPSSTYRSTGPAYCLSRS